MSGTFLRSAVAISTLYLFADPQPSPHSFPLPHPLEEIARSDRHQWTGVAVSPRGDIFVNFPRWQLPISMSVAKLRGNDLVPFPDEAWNSYDPERGRGDGGLAWVCVQSVHVDDRGRLWVLDPAAPQLGKVVRDEAGGPKLVEVDPDTGEVARVIQFDATIAPENSYLNDVRLDTGRNVAFITDSGAGAIVVVDLERNTARRLLADHASTKADKSVVPIIGGKELRTPDGDVPQIHSDGIAVDAEDGYVYWQALTGKTLYRAPIDALLDRGLSGEQLAKRVERVDITVVTDGMEIDARGNLYFSDLERDAITVRTPDGVLANLAVSESLRWPDSFALRRGPEGEERLYVATSQIHRTPPFAAEPPRTPWLVLSTTPLGATTNATRSDEEGPER